MSEHVGYIVKIEELHPHSNADRLQIAKIFGASVIVDLNTQIGDIGIYFPIDLQLSEEYCRENDLVRRKDENGNAAGGYLEPNKRNIRAMRLRGEKSEGLFMPLESLAYTGETKFEVGTTIDILNGHEICRKYIPRMKNPNPRAGSKVRKHTTPIAPLFKEHVDTEQLAYNLNDFYVGDCIEITLKMHGTSQRTGYLPKLTGYKRTLWDRLLRREGKPIYDWGYVTGTRRVVLKDFDSAGGYYGDNAFRAPAAAAFEGKLWKGETVYYEVVGFTTSGTPIMGEVANNKVSDKEFTKKYGKTTIFSYGCEPPQADFYVYRMTMTNEDGDVVEYPPDFVRYRCEQMGVKFVIPFVAGYIPEPNEDGKYAIPNEDISYSTPGEWVKHIAEEYYDGPDPVGKTHVREGVVVRIVNRPKFCAYKHKNFNFKVLSGIAADLAAESGMADTMDEDILAEL